MEEKELNVSEYPYNLIRCVLGEGFMEHIRCPAELPVALEYVLLSLTERAHIVIRKRFQEKKTLSKAGEELDLSRERIRQIENKVIRRLRHPHCAWFLIYGITGEVARREKNTFEKGYSEGSSNAKKYFWEKAKNKSVMTLDMAPQAVKILKKNGVNTVVQLADQSYYWLRNKIGVFESVSAVRKLELLGCDTRLMREAQLDKDFTETAIKRKTIEVHCSIYTD